MTNMCVVLVSFLIIVPAKWENPDNWKDYESMYWLFRNVLIHTVPLTVSSINMYLLTDTIVYISDIWLVSLICYSYLIIQYYYVFITGVIVYEGEDWDWTNYKTWASITILPLIATAFYILNTIISQLIHFRFEIYGEWWK